MLICALRNLPYLGAKGNLNQTEIQVRVAYLRSVGNGRGHMLTVLDIYKSMKVHMNRDVKGKGRATVENEDGGSDTLEVETMPEGSLVELDDDDGEGRFFGGGITKDTAEILDFIDERGGGDSAVGALPPFDLPPTYTVNMSQPEKINSVWLRKMALSFEKRISQNAELRAKFEEDPEKSVSTIIESRDT
jgi:beta-catenin-like protein 1